MTSRRDPQAGQLLVPEALYGRAADVRRAAARFVTTVRKGRSIHEALAGDMVPVDAKHPGLIVLDRNWSMVSTDEPHFHLDLPWRQLDRDAFKRGDHASFDRASLEALAQPWSFIGLLGGQRYSAVTTAAAQLRTLEAAAVHWPVLAAVGARYTQGSNVGMALENMPTLVAFCLARQGANLNNPPNLTPPRLHKHIAHLPGIRIRALLEHRDVARAVAMLEGHAGITLLSLAEHFLAFGLDDVACDAVARRADPDPYGTVARWLDGRGDPSRVVG